jgi:putative heme-binding domain-containing protein
LEAENAPLRIEAVRSLSQQSNPVRFELLAEIAEDDAKSDDVRAEAIVGLSADAEKHRDRLEKLAASDNTMLRREAGRALRLAGLKPPAAEAKPPADDREAWKKLFEMPGNAVAGRRLFFSPVGARCGVCHKYAGRGGTIGPDLTQLGGNSPREKIIESILQPSLEVAPHYQPWILITRDGKTHTGLRLPKGGDDGKEQYVDTNGKSFTLASSEIEERRAATKSIMPDNVQSILSIEDLRDLVTLLTSGSSQQ